MKIYIYRNKSSLIHNTRMVANIWVAAADNQVDVVKSYVESGNFSADCKDPNGYTPIHAAASYGHTDLLKYLVSSKGGNVNVQDNEGDTPLHHVEDVKTAQFLVEELKADPKIKNADGLTPAQYIEEDDEFPDVVTYLQTLTHDVGAGDSETNEFINSLPAPGTIDGHEIRYTMENGEEQESVSEEELQKRREKIQAILDGDNPEEALRELVRNAVQEGMSQFTEQNEPTTKKRKD